MRTILFSSLIMAALSAHAQTPLRITGTIDWPEHNLSVVSTALVSAFGDTVATKRSRSDRFHFTAQGGQVYLVSFAQPGCLTKEVIVDATHLPPLREGQTTRHLRFEVIMDEGDPAVHLRYIRPVGSINYHKQHGYVEVTHDYALQRTVNGTDEAVEY